MFKNCHIVLFIFYFQYAVTQYASYQSKPPKTNICDSSSNTARVELFFNLIFTEFHINAPVCVCVQMCIDQPTYCYPNGCLKKTEIKKKTDDNQLASHVTSVDEKQKAPTFLINDQSNYMKDYLDRNSESNFKAVKIEPPSRNEIRPDPFKDRYKSMFKYKKVPKIHLRYNLREQVKNKNVRAEVMKVDKIDISKTRWPPADNNNQFILGSRDGELNDDVDSRNENYYPQMILESKPSKYTSKFFKRDLRNKNKFDKPAPNSDEKIDTPDSITFSLETLIENLIENSFGPLPNDTEIDLNINLGYAVENITTREPITAPTNKRSLRNGHTIIIINETGSKVNSTSNTQNENTDNKDIDEVYKNAFNQMIDSLSKNIDKQNNNSMEIMEKLIGSQIIYETDETTVEDTTMYSTNATTKSDTVETVSEHKTESIITVEIPPDKKEVVIEATSIPAEVATEIITNKKKSRQTFNKKLLKSKNN